MIQRVICTIALLVFTLPALAATRLETPVKSPADHREYRAIRLDNGLRALLISNPAVDKAAISMEIGVGSGSDPDTHPGLAHFLEHMLFLGTDRFPEAGAYQSWVSDHGGRHNAFTAYDRTNYFLDVDASHLEGALERFSRFFIAPRLDPRYVDRERHAVHSEYQAGIRDDGRRGWAALKAALNPDHPLSRFSVGSLETLRDQPGSKLLDALRDFYRRWYRADNMALVIQAPQPLDELEQLAERFFLEVPRGEGKLPERQIQPLFRPGQLPAELHVRTLRNERSLSLLFPVPNVKAWWRQKPLQYIGAVIGDEGPGSLLEMLRRRGWALSLSAGAGFVHDDASTFSIHLELTPEGYEHRDEVVSLIFAQINQLRRTGPERWRYDELRRIADTGFRFREPGQALYDVLRLASPLREYPSRDILRADSIYEQFDADLISRYLDRLTPDNLLLTVSAPDMATDRVEPTYEVPYALAQLDASRITPWQAAVAPDELQLPPPNPFLAEDLSLEPPAGMKRPVEILSEDAFRLWYQQDDQFRVPRANFWLSLRSPVANDSPRHAALTRLYVALAEDALNSFIYPAQVAGFRVSLYPHVRGFSLRISGYSDRQTQLLERILTTLAGLEVDPQRFEVLRAEAIRTLENRRTATPYERAFARMQERLLSPWWSDEQMIAALRALTPADLAAFAPRLTGAGNLVALAHGNLSRAEALSLGRLVKRLLADRMAPVEVPPARALLLPEGASRMDVAVDHDDVALIRFFQAAEEGLRDRARFALLNKLLKAPFYEELRTEKQRGYIVFATPHPVQERAGLALVVQSPSTPLETLAEDVDQFLARFGQEMAGLDEARLDRIRQALLVELLDEDRKLDERTSRYWQEIDRGYLDFDSREQLAAAIRQVSVADLKALWARLGDRVLEVRAARTSG